MSKEMSQFISEGQVWLNSRIEEVEKLPWHPHAKCAGVSLKHLITAKDTDGKFSSHLVRINQGCEISRHIHAGTWELHEVVQGCGNCQINQNRVNYRNGVTTIIPADAPHAVQATESDLYILAKFVPALL